MLSALKVHKIKRPGGVGWFDVEPVGEDEFGIWLHAARGSAWQAPHDVGTLSLDVLLLISPARYWVAWWVDDPADRRLEIDVCLQPDRVVDGWSFVDLELDVVRHEGGAIEIHDRDEFAIACRNGWIDASQADIAEATAIRLESALRERREPLGDNGWAILEGLRAAP